MVNVPLSIEFGNDGVTDPSAPTVKKLGMTNPLNDDSNGRVRATVRGTNTPVSGFST
jgi:hypothetical protein